MAAESLQKMKQQLHDLDTGIQNISQTTTKGVSNGRAWANLLSMAIVVLGAAIAFEWGNVLGWLGLPPGLLPPGVGVLASLAGLILLPILNGESKVERLHWRVVGGIGSVLAMLAGVTLLVWPSETLLIGANQSTIGAIVGGAGLLGLFFAIYDAGFKGMVKEHQILFASLLLLVGYGIAVTFAWDHKDLPGVAGMGLIVLLTTLLVGNTFSSSAHIEKGHVRTAITLGVMASYFGLLGFGQEITAVEGSVLKATLDHFWLVLLSVVGFYFGSMSADRIALALERRGRAAGGTP